MHIFTAQPRPRLRKRWLAPLLGLAAAAAVTLAPSIASAQSTVPATVTATSHFIQTATSSNTSGDSTFINNGATNGLPHAVLFVTPSWNAGGVCGCVYDNKPVGVWYDSGNSEWAIFNEDGSAIPTGAAFNVLVVPASSSSVFVQTANSSNSGGDSTFVNSSLTNGQRNAKLQVTQVWNPGGVGGTYNDRPVGVWYDGSQWGIFNEDGSSMAANVSFNVMVGSTSSNGGALKVQTASAANSAGDFTLVNSAKTNGDPNAVVFETPNWNPGGTGGTYDNSATGMWYDSSASEVSVFNQDLGAVPTNAAFNLLIFTS